MTTCDLCGYERCVVRGGRACGERCSQRVAVLVERARIVALLRAKSTWHHEQVRKLRQVEHSAAALALEEMADRIERGET